VRPQDYWWLHPLTAPRVATAITHQLRRLGVTAQQEDRAVDVVVTALESEGPLDRRALRGRLVAEGITVVGQSLVHLLSLAGVRGLIVRGPMLDGGHAFVSVEKWLGAAPPPLPRPEALARLACRYLEGHGPAVPEDLSKWAGITVGEARLAFGEVSAAGDVHEVGAFFVRGEPDAGHSVLPPARLLGPFDPLLHGWASRELWIGAHRNVVTTNGIFRPIVLAGGRAVGTWRLPATAIVVDLFEPVSDEVMADVIVDAHDVYRFVGRQVPSEVVRVV
jgi:hypothetical protein